MRTPDTLYIQDQTSIVSEPTSRMVTGCSRTTPLWSSLGLRYIDRDSVHDANYDLHPHTDPAVGGGLKVVQLQVS